MRFVVVTGMSGSGKTQALKMLEDMGYFCVDNLPLALIGKFAELAAAPAQEYSKVALGLDVRSLYKGKGSVDRFLEIMKDYPHEILFLDCSQEQLVRRYKYTRRLHPLSAGGRIEDGISAEREYLMPLRDAADYVVDTRDLLTRQLMGSCSGCLREMRRRTVFFCRSFLSGTNTESLRMRTWFLTSVSFRIRSMWMNCGIRPERTRKCRRMCARAVRRTCFRRK